MANVVASLPSQFLVISIWMHSGRSWAEHGATWGSKCYHRAIHSGRLTALLMLRSFVLDIKLPVIFTFICSGRPLQSRMSCPRGWPGSDKPEVLKDIEKEYFPFQIEFSIATDGCMFLSKSNTQVEQESVMVEEEHWSHILQIWHYDFQVCRLWKIYLQNYLLIIFVLSSFVKLAKFIRAFIICVYYTICIYLSIGKVKCSYIIYE